MSFRELDDVLWKSIESYLPPPKPHTGRPRANMRKLINGTLYVVITGCTWKDVLLHYGSKSTVHRFHLYLREHDTYKKIFNELLNKGYDLKKIDISIVLLIQRIFLPKKGKYRL
jgi:transposase